MWEDPWAQLRKDAARKQQGQTSDPEGQKIGGQLVVDKSDSLAAVMNRAMQVLCFPVLASLNAHRDVQDGQSAMTASLIHQFAHCLSWSAPCELSKESNFMHRDLPLSRCMCQLEESHLLYMPTPAVTDQSHP